MTEIKLTSGMDARVGVFFVGVICLVIMPLLGGSVKLVCMSECPL